MANESLAQDCALHDEEQEFLRLWRLLDANQRVQLFAV